MKTFKKLFATGLLLSIMANFLNCASSQSLEKSIPLEIGDVYFQNWVAGVKGGGSGVNLFIPIISNTNNIILDSVYFRGKKVKLELKNNTLYVGYFKSLINEKKDIVMSSNRIEELNNPVPKIPKNIPFKLENNECVVSYKNNGKTKYHKLSNITEKEKQYLPSAPAKR